MSQCDDPDGSLRRFEWYQDGILTTQTGYKALFPASDKGAVTMRAIDDRGDASDLVAW